MKFLKKTKFADAAGVTMSIACLLHCLAVPFVLVIYTAAGIGVPWEEDATHQIFAVILVFIALVAVVQGMRGHGRLAPALLILLGTVGICVAGFRHDEAEAHGLSTMLTMLSSVLLVVGHLMNRNVSHACTARQSSDNSPSS